MGGWGGYGWGLGLGGAGFEALAFELLVFWKNRVCGCLRRIL